MEVIKENINTFGHIKFVTNKLGINENTEKIFIGIINKTFLLSVQSRNQFF